MKTLGGVGAVVMGAMVLLTVKIGPATPQPAPSGSAKRDPLAAVAAVPEAPPRRTPAAAPHAGASQPATAMERRIVIVVPALDKLEKSEADQDRPVQRSGQLPEAFDCSFQLDLPVNFSAL